MKTQSIKVSFRLNNGKPLITGKEYSIYVRVRGGRKFDFKKSLSFLRIRPNDWNKTTQRVKPKADIIDYQGKNKFLNTLETSIISNCTEYIRTGKAVDLEAIKKMFDDFINPS